MPQDNTDPVSGKTVAEVLGEIAWLMTQDPNARDLPIHEIERVVMPSILLRRFHIRYVRIQGKNEQQAQLQPISVDIYSPLAPLGERRVLVSYAAPYREYNTHEGIQK